MKSLILDQTDTYPSYIAYQESNSFGDQVLTLVYEDKEGYIKRSVVSFPEGQWVKFTADAMFEVFPVLKGVV